MTQLDTDLGQIEKQVLAWTRAPLSRPAPLEDLEDRIRSHEVGETRGQCSGGEAQPFLQAHTWVGTEQDPRWRSQGRGEWSVQHWADKRVRSLALSGGP